MSPRQSRTATCLPHWPFSNTPRLPRVLLARLSSVSARFDARFELAKICIREGKDSAGIEELKKIVSTREADASLMSESQKAIDKPDLLRWLPTPSFLTERPRAAITDKRIQGHATLLD